MEGTPPLHENPESDLLPDLITDSEDDDDPEEPEGVWDGGDSDADDRNDSAEEGEGHTLNDDQKDHCWKPPSLTQASASYSALQRILQPPHNTGHGYRHTNLNDLLWSRLKGMAQFLWNYTDPVSPFHGKWIPASINTAQRINWGSWYARRLRQWCCAFIEDAENLPLNIYGTWNKLRIDDEDLQQEIFMHLQSIGKCVCVMDLVRFTEKLDVRKRHDLKKLISLWTAQYWMNRLSYRWSLEPSGQ